jgi:hypothetical protein
MQASSANIDRVNEMAVPNPYTRTAVKFTHESDFGLFCVKLASDDVPFSLVGNLTVFIDNSVYTKLSQLSEESNRFLTSLGSQLVSIDRVEITGERKPRTREEAKQAIREFTQNYRRP